MLGWIARGLRLGRITTRYPKVKEVPPAGFHGQITVSDASGADPGIEAICPTGAIRVARDGRVELDRGRCVLCGACVRAQPARFAFSQSYESATDRRDALIAGRPPHPRPEPGTTSLQAHGGTLGDAAGALRKSIHVRHIDTGSDGSEEWEIQSLWNPYYDIQRLGFFLTASPRHADILLVTGGVTAPMRRPLELTWQLMPEPKAVIAVGTDACSGGLVEVTGMGGGVDRVIPVDVYIPGSPPPPIALIDGLLLAVGLLRSGDRR